MNYTQGMDGKQTNPDGTPTETASALKPVDSSERVDSDVMKAMDIPHGDGCSHCAASFGNIPTFRVGPDGKISKAEVNNVSSAMEANAMKINDDTTTHENQHLAGLSGVGFGVSPSAPVYNISTMTLPNGKTVQFRNGGHVSFNMPSIGAAGNDPNKLRELAGAFRQIAAAAHAPANPSGADNSAAASAFAGAGQAEQRAAQIEANPNQFKVPDNVKQQIAEKKGTPQAPGQRNNGNNPWLNTQNRTNPFNNPWARV